MTYHLWENKQDDQLGSHITSTLLLSSLIVNRGQERRFLFTTNTEEDYI